MATNKPIKLSAAASILLTSLFASSQNTFAEITENPTALKEINVVAEHNNVDIKDKKVGETVKTAKELKKQQVQDSRDLVRYETGVSVVEAGRFGSSGYAIRGVDENRVAITVDGLHQAETLASEGFKELFEGYGNFNNTRNSTEIETLKQANIVKGANSVKVGNGALGGAVVFETKDARDYLIDKDWYVSYKTGYSTADNQNINSLTLAGRYKGFDALLVKTKRDGHELENYDYKYFDASVQGRKREKADPYEKELDSTLLKLSFQPNDNHRFTLMTDLYDSKSKGADLSYTLKATRLTDFGNSRDEYEYRHNNDRVKRQNYAFSYENYSSNPFWDSLKLTYSEQKIETKAKNEDYCDGNDKCDQVSNPLGLKYNENNELVGKDGKPIEYENKSQGENVELRMIGEVTEADKTGYHNSSIRFERMKERLEKEGVFDSLRAENPNSSISNCLPYGVSGDDNFRNEGKCQVSIRTKLPDINNLTAAGTVYDLNDSKNSQLFSRHSTNVPLRLSCDGINCDKNSITVFNKDGTKKELPFTVENNMAILGVGGTTTLNSPDLFLPPSQGYNQNLWTDRSLNTKTKQINLDLTKYLELGNTQHNISYGALLSKVEKEMINRSGDSPSNLKWWALHPENCATSSSTLCNKSNLYSFLIPVKATNTALYFANDFKINSYLSFDVGYRYDRIKYKPNYVAGVTPKIPSDMIDGLAKNFVNPFQHISVPTLSKEPSFLDKDENGRDKYNTYQDLTNARNAWNLEKEKIKKIEEENKQIDIKNKLARDQANIDAIAQSKKYSVHSYSLGMNLDPTDYLRLQFKYSKGFRSPTSDEIYFTFKHPDFTVLPNLDLEPESAKTQQVALTLYKDFGFVSLNAFQTKYDNFIDLAYQGERSFNTGGGGNIGYPIHQNVNREYAKVKGFDIDSRLNLGVFSEKLKEISLSYKLTYQKGKVQVTEELEGRLPDGSSPKESLLVPMNAIQPLKMVYGLNYNHNSGKFGFDIYVTHSKAKEAKDTYNQSWRDQRAKELSINDPSKNVTKDSTRRWRSGSYTIVDFIAYAKPIKNLTLQFGVYNLTNKKYITWDSARSIKQIGTSNRIDYLTGEGINRFYSPGRNFKLNAELTF